MDAKKQSQVAEFKLPSKEERQRLFVEQCRREGLSSQQMVERASVFPSGVPSKVLSWPKL